MIVSTRPSPQGARATIINSGKGTVFSSAYTGFKHVSKVLGFYQDIRPYLPETYLDKYRYKPHKRAYAELQKTQGFLKTGHKQYKKRGRPWSFTGCDTGKLTSCKSS